MARETAIQILIKELTKYDTTDVLLMDNNEEKLAILGVMAGLCVAIKELADKKLEGITVEYNKCLEVVKKVAKERPTDGS